MNGSFLARRLNVEIKYKNKIDRLKNTHRMIEYKFNTTAWKMKNDIELWERIQKSELNKLK